MKRRNPLRGELLKARLDTLVETFDVSTISPDPLELVLRYDQPLDQEVAGLIAAAFAYGRADIIVTNIGGVLAKMGPSPFAYLQAFDAREASRRFSGFTHRFHKTPDLVAFLAAIARAIERHGSLGALFELCYDAGDADIAPSLSRFVLALRDLPDARRLTPAVTYLLTSPTDGSACKRMNLFLRWMIRRTSPDLGLWSFADPAKLVMPLDTHVHRIATFLGLSDRKSADWKAARALTDRLARFDAADPVRYDFALCRLGILDLCSVRQKKENCDVCLLNDVCRFPVRA
ncbi:MAG TPA: TIGR02757 family protein [Thermoanaerobaculia bacterium]|nr:TIGR02757 family protein [Thermoanaerobaculia bacterium]